MSDVILFLCVF